MLITDISNREPQKYKRAILDHLKKYLSVIKSFIKNYCDLLQLQIMKIFKNYSGILQY